MTEARINLPFPPSVNGLYANMHNVGRVKTEPYKEWLNEAGWALKIQRVAGFNGPVTISYTFGKKKGRYDLSNFLKPIDDLLVAHAVIADDNSKIITGFTVTQDPELEGVLVHVSALESEAA